MAERRAIIWKGSGCVKESRPLYADFSCVSCFPAVYTAAVAPSEHPRTDSDTKFHGWRLLGVIAIVVVVLAIVSLVVDWAVIGPLEGRVF